MKQYYYKTCALSILVLFLATVSSINSVTSSSGEVETEDVHLTIPFPSGIIIDRVEPMPNWIYRFGRLQHNSVKLRPEWSEVTLVENVLNAQDCQELINKAEEYAMTRPNGWNSTRHIDHAIRPVDDVSIDQLFAHPSTNTNTNDNHNDNHNDNEDNRNSLDILLMQIHKGILLPMANSYQLDYRRLHIDDLFINKYNATGHDVNKRALAPHTDKSPFSFVLLLSDPEIDFVGGGTVFPDMETLWTPGIGSAVFFSGTHLHGGRRITSGVRYVLAGFLTYGGIVTEGDSDSNVNNDGGNFLADIYNPEYDGYAYESGFHYGDLIVGIEVCIRITVAPINIKEEEEEEEVCKQKGGVEICAMEKVVAKDKNKEKKKGKITYKTYSNSNRSRDRD
jgi:hypothetical protein